MTEKEMIEEMAKEIFNTCAWRFGKPNDYKEICKDIAEDLIKLGYTKNKIPDGSVVLTNDELNDLEYKAYSRGVCFVCKKVDEQKEKVRKETAKEILSKLFPSHNVFNDNDVLVIWQLKDILKELAKQFGVEVEE